VQGFHRIFIVGAPNVYDLPYLDASPQTEKEPMDR
jgi:hypothetical protein